MSEQQTNGGNGSVEVYKSGEIEVGSPRNLPAPLHDTATAAAASKAQAMVQAHFLMALRSPRNWLDVRRRMLEACKRTRFAEVARYSIPRGGKKIEGWSIRFAEEAMRDMRNLMPESAIVGEDDDKRIIKVSVIDLESNIPLSTEFVLLKIVERKKLKDGEQAIRTRINSQGETLYIMPATDDDLLVKQAALVSKALRTLLLRLLPGDILDECLDEVQATLKSQDEKDPRAAVKKIADAFASIGVKPTDLAGFLGVELEAASPAQIAELRAMYQAIRDGEATWKEFATPVAADGEPNAQQVSLAEKVKKKAEAAKKPPDAAPPPAAAAAPKA